MKFGKKIFIRMIVLVCTFASILAFSSFQAGAASKFNIKGTVLYGYNGTNTSVFVPTKVKTIGKKAFAANQKVKKVVIKQGVSQVRSFAFKGCTKLKKIEIPASVKKIAKNAFSGCKNLTIITQKGTYALKFAKKNKISWKKKN